MQHVMTAVSEAIISDANHLAMVWGQGPEDANTFGHLFHRDSAGNLYSVRNLWVSPEWLGAVGSPLVRPDWDADQSIDMDAAGRAQAALVYATSATPALPGAITAIGGMDSAAALAAMGLEQA